MKKVSVTGAGRLWEFNTEFVREVRKTGFEKAAVSRAVHSQEHPLGELPL